MDLEYTDSYLNCSVYSFLIQSLKLLTAVTTFSLHLQEAILQNKH